MIILEKKCGFMQYRYYFENLWSLKKSMKWYKQSKMVQRDLLTKFWDLSFKPGDTWMRLFPFKKKFAAYVFAKKILNCAIIRPFILWTLHTAHIWKYVKIMSSVQAKRQNHVSSIWRSSNWKKGETTNPKRKQSDWSHLFSKNHQSAKSNDRNTKSNLSYLLKLLDNCE